MREMLQALEKLYEDSLKKDHEVFNLIIELVKNSIDYIN